MRKDSARTRKIGELLQRELAAIIPRELRDARVANITLTAVDVAPDLSHAKVYFTVLGGEAQVRRVLSALNRVSSFLRHRLRERIILRHTPELRFIYDASVERGDKIERLLARARGEHGE